MLLAIMAGLEWVGLPKDEGEEGALLFGWIIL